VSGSIRVEKLGKPGVFVVTDNFGHDARSSAEDNGMPTIRIVTVPAQEYYKHRITKEEVRPVGVGAFNEIIGALTRPLTAQEQKPKPKQLAKISRSMKINGASYELAVEKFNQVYLDNHWGDGLPLVPPTPARVNWMLKGTSRSPKEVVGTVAPKNGTATIEKIAVNAVMAGARPEYFPVIIAVMEGLTDKNFDLLHIATSSGSFSLIIMVNGPIAKEIKMNAGIGFLGYGWQANNTIGRAVRLSLINLGHLWPAENDMALIGRPSSHTFYTFAENEENSPWEPYHVSLGFKKEDSCVTVSTIGSYEGGATIYGGGAVAIWSAKSILEKIVAEIKTGRKMFGLYKRSVANPTAHPRKHIIMLAPECAIELQRLGYTRESLQKYLYDTTSVPYEELKPEEIRAIEERIDVSMVGGSIQADIIPQDRIPVFKEALKPGGKVPVVITPADLPIFVAGGIPAYSFGLSYIRAPYKPFSHQTKLIRGATLTKAGR
jgi:hypothetical protein